MTAQGWQVWIIVFGVGLVGCGAVRAQAPAADPASAESLSGLLTEQAVELDRALESALGAMEKQVNETAKAWPATVDETKGAETKKKVVEEWKKQTKAIAESLKGKLLASDDALLAKLAAPAELDGKLSGHLRKSRDTLLKSLRGDAEATPPVVGALNVGTADVEGSSLDPTKPAEKALPVITAALKKTRDESKKALGEALRDRTKGEVAFLQANRQTASEEAKARIEQFEDDQVAKFTKQFVTDTGLSKVVRCSWSAVPNRLKCLPDGLLVSGEEISEIRIDDLPAGKKVTVKAFSVADTSSLDLEEKKLVEGAEKAAEQKATDPTYERDRDPSLNLRPCGLTGATPNRLTCDMRTFTTFHDRTVGDGRSQGRTVVIAVHKNRSLWPSYGGKRMSNATATRNLRRSDREKLSLVVSGRSPEIIVHVWVEEPPDAGTATSRGEESVRSASIPVAYRRWGVETSAFFASSTLTDQELVTEAGTGDKVKAVKAIDGDNYSQQTGIFLSVFPRNYPSLGLGLGFHTETGRAASVYFGPTLRLRSIGEQGVITFSTGLAAMPVRRFPGVDFGKEYDSGSAVLQGKLELHTHPYALLSMGFRFGPIGAEGAGR